MSERLTSEQVAAIEAWATSDEPSDVELVDVAALCREWRAQRAVVEAARASDAYWSQRFGCAYQEMAALIAEHPKLYNPENHLWVALAQALAALRALDGGEGEEVDGG